MQIPRDFIQLLLSKIDIIDFVDQRLPLQKKSNNNYFACCPFHNEKTASFSVSYLKQFYYCFGCGAHGNVIDFLMQYDRLTFPEAIHALATEAGLEVPHEAGASPKIKPDNHAYAICEQASAFYQTELHHSSVATAYLNKRGISDAVAKEFGLGFAPGKWDAILTRLGSSAGAKQTLYEAGMIIKKEDGGYYDRFRERIMFPIHNRRGKMIGFGGRVLNNEIEPKYLNSPETAIFQKGHELYGLYYALKYHRQLPCALVVEGYMDVIALFQHGITYAVATLGTATTAFHVNYLLRYTNHLVFCFDGDSAGRKAAWRAVEVLLPLMKDGVQIRFMFLPEGEDPDSLIRQKGKPYFEQCMDQGLSLANFFFQTISMQANVSSLDGRARFVKLANEYIKKLPAGIFQQMMWEELSKKGRVQMQQLNTTIHSPVLQPAQRLKTPSTLRLAMILLIQYPYLVSYLKDNFPASLDLKGFDLFREIKDILLHHPGMTTGALLEYWREREEQRLLVKLAHTEHMVPEEGVEKEFLGVVNQLRRLAYTQQIDFLLAKAAENKLTLEEKQQLSQLITNKEK